MPQNVRVRFAPSPTGPLHIGGVRTAFYNYLFAKKHQGQFILRIEDTDQNRLVPQSESYIQEALTWLGITPDESPQKGGEMGPYRQSERKSLYEKYALALVKAGKAYYAFDTPEELEAMRAKFKAIGQAAPQYNAISRMQMKNSLTLSQEEVSQRLKQGQPYVIRMLIDPQITIKAKDTIRGWVQVKGVNLDDKVLLKADGMATYHLANVVDDHFMQITHVIRGEEWLPSLAYHILLYEYFQWEKPEFVHLPLLLNANGKGKLSKRNTQQHDFPILPLDWQDAHTQQTLPGFKQAGYLKEALLNFIALLGWHPSHNQELFTCDELIANFSLSRISKSGACFDIDKAKWFNQKYVQKIEDEVLATHYLLPDLAAQNIACTKSYATKISSLLKKSITFPQELALKSQYFFYPPDKDVLQETFNANGEAKAFLADLLKKLSEVDDFQSAYLQALIQTAISAHSLKKGQAMQIIRLAVTGQKAGPSLAELLEVLGREEVTKRIKNLL